MLNLLRSIILDLSDIAPPTNDPMVSLESVSLTCGQEVFVENLTGVSLNIQCKFLYNGSEPLTYEVYKNGVVYKGGVLSKKVFSLTIFPASNDDYGEYTFVALTEFCGLTFVMSRVIAVMYAGQLFLYVLYVCIKYDLILENRPY